MKIAVAGCVHGRLDVIYDDLLALQATSAETVDLVLICGDFQTVRNENDLKCMAVKDKFKQLGDFHKYYSGEKEAPFLTLFIGGNHEASNYLMTLPYGGWVCRNIYYMGYAGVVRFNGLRIAAISGIYHQFHKNCGHFESLPFDENSKRSIYHTRNIDVYRLLQVANNDQDVDIFLSHDWPLNIHSHGNVNRLLRLKPFFAEDISNESLGNPLCLSLLNHLKPRYWFAAHLHVRFDATVNHGNGKVTKFLALDKCLPRRSYLEIIEVEPEDNRTTYGLEYDPDWLAILKNTDQFMSIEKQPKTKIPGFWNRLPIDLQNEIKKLQTTFGDSLKIPENFEKVSPLRNETDEDPQRAMNFVNPQTALFCEKLAISDPVQLIINSKQLQTNPEEILLSDDDLEEQLPKKFKASDQTVTEEQGFVIDKKGSSS